MLMAFYVRQIKKDQLHSLRDHALVLSYVDGKQAKNMPEEALMATLHVQTQCSILP